MVKITGEAKFIGGIIIGCLVLIIGAMLFLTKPTVQQIDRSALLSSETVTKGAVDAKVYLVEFSDFQCPACGAIKPEVDRLLEKYKERVLFGYRHFPLPQHQFAVKAAEAAEAANEQGKFWQMYDYLFAHQDQLSDQLISNSAKSIGLDEEKFRQDMESAKIKDKVTKDLVAGKALKINSTPTFYLNGKKIELSSLADLEGQIESELAK